MRRQDPRGGIAGRVNKDPDSCYTFWVGAALVLLERESSSAGVGCMLNAAEARQFLAKCESRFVGGFAKIPGAIPDLHHSFYAAAWLGLVGGEMEALDAALGISSRARARLVSLCS